MDSNKLHNEESCLSGGRTCKRLRVAAPRLCRGTLWPCPDLALLQQRAEAGQLLGVSSQHAGPRSLPRSPAARHALPAGACRPLSEHAYCWQKHLARRQRCVAPGSE